MIRVTYSEGPIAYSHRSVPVQKEIISSPPPHEMGPATEKSKHPELDMERVHQVRNELSEVRGNEKHWERATRGTPTEHIHSGGLVDHGRAAGPGGYEILSA